MGGATPKARDRGDGALRRSAARLAAVQALYQVELSGLPAEDVIAQFAEGRTPDDVAEGERAPEIAQADIAFMGAIVRGVIARREGLDELIAGALTVQWPVARLEILLRLILEAGAFELTERSDIPPRVVINEYMNVAHAFFDAAEGGLVNGVLDAIARSCRAEEMARGRG